MDAWPIEEVWLRPAVTPVACVLAPFATAWVLRAVLSRDRRQVDRAGAVAGLAHLELGWWLGVTALGPRLVEAPGGLASHAFGAACATMAAASTWRAFAWAVDLRALAAIAFAATAAAAISGWVGAPRGWIGAGVLGVIWSWTAVRGWRRRRARDAHASPDGEQAGAEPSRSASLERQGGALAAGLVVSALIASAAALAWTLTEIDEGAAPDASTDAARWRLRVDPWDATGMLAAAWASRRRGELDRALAQAREARRMGLPEAPALELEAEVLAARGRCGEARAAFDRALRARAEQVFERDPLASPLSLGGYHLPPTLVTECDGLDALPALELTAP